MADLSKSVASPAAPLASESSCGPLGPLRSLSWIPSPETLDSTRHRSLRLYHQFYRIHYALPPPDAGLHLSQLTGASAQIVTMDHAELIRRIHPIPTVALSARAGGRADPHIRQAPYQPPCTTKEIFL